MAANSSVVTSHFMQVAKQKDGLILECPPSGWKMHPIRSVRASGEQHNSGGGAANQNQKVLLSMLVQIA